MALVLGKIVQQKAKPWTLKRPARGLAGGVNNEVGKERRGRCWRRREAWIEEQTGTWKDRLAVTGTGTGSDSAVTVAGGWELGVPGREGMELEQGTARDSDSTTTSL